MTTDSNDRFDHDSTMAEVHEEVLADEVDDIDPADDDREVEGAAFAQMLTSEMFSADVRAYVDEILRPGQPPAPALQNRMADTARRVLRQRRLPLPVLLADARLAQQLPVSEVIAAMGIDEAILHDLEFGDTEIRTLTPTQVAAWSKAVRLDATETLAGLRNTLSLRTAAPSQVAAGAELDAQTVEADEQYIAEVARLLGL